MGFLNRTLGNKLKLHGVESLALVQNTKAFGKTTSRSSHESPLLADQNFIAQALSSLRPWIIRSHLDSNSWPSDARCNSIRRGCDTQW